ncbi:MAG: PHP domain-containing protein [Deltaproteobacteria bacterium]|nr:PHP domain-containing protein [Deltaproteobacteria bacterium]
MNDFVHLHLHTHFSFLDATNRIPELMQAVKRHGQSAVAVTEHGNLSSAAQFYREAREHDLKPIIGCEVYVTPGDHRDRNAAQKKSNHLVLLAENETGFRNLIKLVSTAHLDGYYYRPRCDHELLEKYAEGLICTSACLSGELAVAIAENRIADAERLADWHRQIFKDRYYLEIQHNGLERQERVNIEILKIAKRLDLPVVATNDCHYLRPEDANPHDVLLCVGTGKTVSEQNRKRYESEAFYLRSSREMADLFHDTPGAVKSTLEIAERCQFEWSTGGFLFPEYDVPAGETIESVFTKMSREGFERRFAKIAAKIPTDTEKKPACAPSTKRALIPSWN